MLAWGNHNSAANRDVAVTLLKNRFCCAMNFLVRGFFGCLLKEVGPRSGRQRPGVPSFTGRFQTCTHVLIRVGFLRRGDRLGNRAVVFQLGLGQDGTQPATCGPTVRNRWACAGADAGPWGDDIVPQRSGLVKPSLSTSSRSQPMAMITSMLARWFRLQTGLPVVASELRCSANGAASHTLVRALLQ